MKPLSTREQEVIELLVGGLSQKEVAVRMGVSLATVRCYIMRVQVKTGKPTMLSAVAFALINGMVLVNSA